MSAKKGEMAFSVITSDDISAAKPKASSSALVDSAIKASMSTSIHGTIFSHVKYSTEHDKESNGLISNSDSEKQETFRDEDASAERNSEPSLAEVLLHLADQRVLAGPEARGKIDQGANLVQENRVTHVYAGNQFLRNPREHSIPSVPDSLCLPNQWPQRNTDERLKGGVAIGKPSANSKENAPMQNKNFEKILSTGVETKLNTQETATQSAVAALLGFAFQTKDTPTSAAAADEQSYEEWDSEDNDDNDDNTEDCNSYSNDEIPDTSILGPEARELAEAWVASKSDNSKKADWEYIEAHTTGHLQEVIKEKRKKFAETFVENSLFHLRQYIPKGTLKDAFLAYRNSIAKQRFGVSDAYKSRPRKKKDIPLDDSIDDGNSISHKTPGRRRRYGEISLVVKESEYNKPLEVPIMIDCHLTQELIELTRLLVVYNIVPAGRGGKIKLEHLERAGASESLIMLCNSKRTSKITETITLTNLISSKYVRDGFETFLAEATKSYSNGGPIFGPSFCTRDVDEGKLSIPIALGLKEEHKELSRLLLLGNRGNVKTTKTRSFEWKLVDWDVVVKNASQALAHKISARRKNKSFTNHAINNLVNNNAEQKAIIVYIERLRRRQLGLIPQYTSHSREENEVLENFVAVEPLASESIEDESFSTEDDQSHIPLKKRKRLAPPSVAESICAATYQYPSQSSVPSEAIVISLPTKIPAEQATLVSERGQEVTRFENSTFPVANVPLDRPNQEDAEMLLSVGVQLKEDLISMKVKRPIMENSYKERMTDDGCYRPSRDPQKKGDGTFARPRGRGPPGMGWDPVRGLFVPGRGSARKKKILMTTSIPVQDDFDSLRPAYFIHGLIGPSGTAKENVSDLDGDELEVNEDSLHMKGESANVAFPSSFTGLGRASRAEPVPNIAKTISASQTIEHVEQAIVPKMARTMLTSKNIEHNNQAIAAENVETPSLWVGDISESRTESRFEASAQSQSALPTGVIYGNDASRAFIWIATYCSTLCDYDQGSHRRRQNFSRWYEVEWKIFLGAKTDGDRNAFVEEQKERLAAFKDQEVVLLEHLKTEALKIFFCGNGESSQLTSLSAMLSKLVNEYIDEKINEFSAISEVMGKSLNAYMYLLEDRELKWDDFHDLQEAKLAKHEHAMSWNSHLIGCHNAISRLYH